jgi:hypothetical protein
MTQYNIFNSLAELTSLKKIDNGYSKFIQRGKLSLYDYNHGFLEATVTSVLQRPKGPWLMRLHIASKDDGDYGGWVEVGSQKDALALAERIATEVFKDMISFPTDAQLNGLLQKYGVYATYE